MPKNGLLETAMTDYELSSNLEALAEEVIADHEEFADLDGCRIIYQYCFRAKKKDGKIVFADTERIKNKYKAFIKADFVITFYEPVCGELTHDQLYRIMHHELKHVGFDGEHYSIIPHDIEDFRDIIEEYGFDWLNI